MRFQALLTPVALIISSWAFDNGRYDNVAVYWGQNSYGAVHGTDTVNFQKRLSFYCSDGAIDTFPIAFLNVFFGAGGLPSINLANICNAVDNTTFPGTNLPNCATMASDIVTCQAKGKIITLSLGGASASVGFQSDSQATAFAQTIWNLFLGGSSSTRPFGTAILDGIDLDIEGGGSAFYGTFVNKIRSLASGTSKKYYVTAAPQCVFPDSALGTVLNSASFDAVYGKAFTDHVSGFYNNPCGLQAFGQASNWNFGLWDNWARVTSPNKGVKIYIGAPASSSAAGSGYVNIGTMNSIAVQMRKSFPSFGGVMLWDASQAFMNGRYDLAVKNALTAAGGTGFTFPACSAPAWSTGSSYAGGSTVTFGGYVWQAKWFASSQPASNPSGEWSAITACSGNGQTPTTTCAGVAAWSTTSVYTGGSQAVYNSHLWLAQWWTQGETPGAASVWIDKGACTSLQAVNTFNSTEGAKANVQPKSSGSLKL